MNARGDRDKGAEKNARRRRRRRPGHVRAVVVPVARRRADGDDGLEELHVPLGLAHDVDRSTCVVGVLKYVGEDNVNFALLGLINFGTVKMSELTTHPDTLIYDPSIGTTI